MKLYSFEVDSVHHLGADGGQQLIDLNVAYGVLPAEKRGTDGIPHLPSDMVSFLHLGKPAVEAARRAADFAMSKTYSADIARATRDWATVRILAPIPRPGKILCAGVNFTSHLKENPNAKLPDSPRIFAKLPSVVIGTRDAIVHPFLTRQLDYEVELAAVVGRKMRFVSRAEALDYIVGYTILNDVSARDVQSKDNQITLGKNFETFAPMGPCMVTADEFTNPGAAHLRTLVNGEVRQDGSTVDWIFPVEELLSFLSQFMTLEPGDIVSTGTPAGVGMFRDPPVFLQPGDLVALEIDGIGRLENRVVKETKES